MGIDFGTVAQAVLVGVRILGVGAAGAFLQIGQPITIKVSRWSLGQIAKISRFPEILQAIAIGVGSAQLLQGHPAEQRRAVVVGRVGHGGAIELNQGTGSASQKSDHRSRAGGSARIVLIGKGREVVELEHSINRDVAGPCTAALQEEQLQLVGLSGREVVELDAHLARIADRPQDALQSVVVGRIPQRWGTRPSRNLVRRRDRDAHLGVLRKRNVADRSRRPVGPHVEGIFEITGQIEALSGIAAGNNAPKAAQERIARGALGIGGAGNLNPVRVIVAIGVGAQGIGQMNRDLRSVGQPVQVAVRSQRISQVSVDFGPIR